MVGISNHPEKMSKKSLHRKNDSGELDVFEAARYFSGANEFYTTNFSTTVVPNDKQSSKPRRYSLDMPTRDSVSSLISTTKEKQIKEKKQKQPSSPGGRLASFLNALFNQTSSKKKKSKSFATKSVKDDYDNETPGWRRKRRSSISNFHPTNTDPVQSSASGFRTPPAYVHTPKSSFKEFRSYSENQEILPFDFRRYVNLNPPNRVMKEEKLKFNDEYQVKNRSVRNGSSEADWIDRYSSEEREFRKFSEADNGADSDSSSDLFDLPNCDLDCYSNGLPVYESTRIESLKRIVAPITRGPR